MCVLYAVSFGYDDDGRRLRNKTDFKFLTLFYSYFYLLSFIFIFEWLAGRIGKRSKVRVIQLHTETRWWAIKSRSSSK